MGFIKKTLVVPTLIVGVLVFGYYGVLIYYARITLNRPHLVEAPKLEISFSEAILEISKSVDVCPTYSSLLYNDLFRRLYANSGLYLVDAIALLSHGTVSEKEKSIAILVMKNLDEDQYLCFFEKCTELYLDGLISDDNIAVSTFIIEECFNNTDLIVKNFYRSKIRTCLRKVMAKNQTIAPMGKFILSGRYWLYRIFYMVDCGEIVNDNFFCHWFFYYTFRVVTFFERTFKIFPYQTPS